MTLELSHLNGMQPLLMLSITPELFLLWLQNVCCEKLCPNCAESQSTGDGSYFDYILSTGIHHSQDRCSMLFQTAVICKKAVVTIQWIKLWFAVFKVIRNLEGIVMWTQSSDRCLNLTQHFVSLRFPLLWVWRASLASSSSSFLFSSTNTAAAPNSVWKVSLHK